MLVLIGILIIIAGFLLRFNPLLVIMASALATGLAAGLDVTAIIAAFGKAFKNRGLNPKTGEALGLIPVLGSLALAIGYSIVVGWIMKYTFGAFTGATLNPPLIDIEGTMTAEG